MKSLFVPYARAEITEYYIYSALSRREKKQENKELLERLAQQEKEHYEFWKTLLPGEEPKPYYLSVYLLPLMRRALGLTFTAKLLELHERDAVVNYRSLAAHIPETHRERFEKMIGEEKAHEDALVGAITEKRISYIGFIALGLADAIVEVTGVHAGFLGVTGSTLIAGVSGIIVGFAAAISMGSAAYLQAKQDTEKSPVISALATGVSYIVSVLLLALPYFLLSSMLLAFVASTVVGLLLLAGFTFYGAVVFDRAFWREFSESAGLMLGTALATYLLGQFIGSVFGLSAASF